VETDLQGRGTDVHAASQLFEELIFSNLAIKNRGRCEGWGKSEEPSNILGQNLSKFQSVLSTGCDPSQTEVSGADLLLCVRIS